MKKYLELINSHNQAVFIDANSITAIQNGANGVAIYCIGAEHPFIVQITHFELIKKMQEIGVFELVKFH